MSVVEDRARRGRELTDVCEEVLRGNWREAERDGVRYGYTAPSPGRYPWQWYWDLCFAAIAWRRFDPARARRELESLLRAARDDGFIGHTIFWGSRVDHLRSPFYNVTSPTHFMTSTIQPPLLAWAWSLAVGDPTLVPEIGRHHDWVQRERAIDGDGLLWIVQPDESGLDASPKTPHSAGGQTDSQVSAAGAAQPTARLRHPPDRRSGRSDTHAVHPADVLYGQLRSLHGSHPGGRDLAAPVADA